MLKEQAKLITRLSILADAITIVTAFGCAYVLRNMHGVALWPINYYLWVLIPILLIWCALLMQQRLYSSLRRLSFFDLFLRLGKIHIIGGLILVTIVYLVDRHNFSRGLLVIFVATSFALLFLERCLVFFILGLLRRRGYNVRYMLLVGTCGKAARFTELVKEHEDWGLVIVGRIGVSTASENDAGGTDNFPLLGGPEDLIRVCRERTIDEVIFCLPKNHHLDVDSYLEELSKLGITSRMVLDFYEQSAFHKELSFFHGELPILTFHNKAFDVQQLLLKRILDIGGALVGLFFTAVIFPAVALAIKLESPGPLFFGQVRVRENGRHFICWKFRTMYRDAEERKATLMDDNEMTGAMFKLRNDPRITRVGRLLRSTSLDELPQFWNVIKGEMSLVGTRPPTPEEVNQYQNWHYRRISIRPGITGMWQISGRSNIKDFDEIVKLDLRYIDHWSLWLDIKILLRTLVVVVTRKGSF